VPPPCSGADVEAVRTDCDERQMREPAPTLAALLTETTSAAEVPVAEVPALLALVASEQARLAAVQGALAARLAAGNGTPCRPVNEAPAIRYVTQAEAAAMFNIPLSTVRYLTRRGRVQTLGNGKNRRLLPADLARYLDVCKRTGRPLRPSGARAARKPLTRTMPLE